MTTKRILVVALVAIAWAIGACGGDDDHSSSGPAASQTQTSTSGSSQRGDGRSGGANGDGSSTGAGGGDQASGGNSGGSGAPRVLRPPRKRSLQRYLARHYRDTPWYPLLRRLRISGGHVTVYLKFPPESDDENPPVLACNAVASYGKQVTRVTVYGSPTPQGQVNLVKQC
jgi:hypothetical protein